MPRIPPVIRPGRLKPKKPTQKKYDVYEDTAGSSTSTDTEDDESTEDVVAQKEQELAILRQQLTEQHKKMEETEEKLKNEQLLNKALNNHPPPRPTMLDHSSLNPPGRIQNPLDWTDAASDASIARRMKDLHVTDPTSQKLSFLNPEAQMLKDRADQTSQFQEILKLNKLMFDTLCKVLPNDQQQRVAANLQQTENVIELNDKKLRQDKVQLQEAAARRDCYKVTLNIPKYVRPPDSYERDRMALAQKTIAQSVIVFDRSKNPDQDFTDVWTKLVQYGTREYFTEEEYMSCLPILLTGPPLEEFFIRQRRGESLSDILNFFAVRYCKQVTVREHQAAVDHFTRLKTESLQESMARASTLIDKLEILHSAAAWPEIREKYRKDLMLQIMKPNVKQYLTLEDATLREEGGEYSVDALIKIASRYEITQGLLPEKDMETVFQTASGGLRTTFEDPMSQLKASKKQQWKNKDLESKVDDIATFVANAATFKPRSRSMEKTLHQLRPLSKTIRKDRDTDVRMRDESIDRTQANEKRSQSFHPFYPDRTDNRDRGRTPERRDRSQNDNRHQTPASGDRSQSRDRSSSRSRRYGSDGPRTSTRRYSQGNRSSSNNRSTSRSRSGYDIRRDSKGRESGYNSSGSDNRRNRSRDRSDIHVNIWENTDFFQCTHADCKGSYHKLKAGCPYFNDHPKN